MDRYGIGSQLGHVTLARLLGNHVQCEMYLALLCEGQPPWIVLFSITIALAVYWAQKCRISLSS